MAVMRKLTMQALAHSITPSASAAIYLVPGLVLFAIACASPAVATMPDDSHAEQSTAAPALTLQAAIAEGLSANPSAAVARQQFIQAQARWEQAAAQRRLQISFTSSVSGSNVDVIQPPPAHETFGLIQNTLTIPLPFGKRAYFASEQSRLLLDAAQAQWEGTRLAFATQVSTAYYDLLRKQALRQVAQTTSEQAERQQEEAQKRFRAGDVPELDVLRAQVPVATAQAGFYQASNDVVVAQQALNALLGRPLAAPLVIADVSATGVVTLPTPYDGDTALRNALTVNADVRVANATVRANEAALAGARRYREPVLSLQVSDIRGNDQTGFSREDTVQASLTIPLSDGGLGRAQVREAEAALAEAKAQATVARRALETSISAAYLNANSTRRQIQAATTARDIAQLTYDKTLRGYTSGLFPLTDVLSAQNALRQAKIGYIQAIYDAAAAATILENAVGGGPALPAPGGIAPSPTIPSDTKPPLPPRSGSPGNNPAGTNPTPSTPTGTTP